MCILVAAAATIGLSTLSIIFEMLVRVSLIAAILGVLFPRDDSRRAFWTGYVVFGWGAIFLIPSFLNLGYLHIWFKGLGLLGFSIIGGLSALKLHKATPSAGDKFVGNLP